MPPRFRQLRSTTQDASRAAAPPKPPAPPRLALAEQLAAAIRHDRLTFGKPCIARVVANFDRETLLSIMLDPEFGEAWKRAARDRLRALNVDGQGGTSLQKSERSTFAISSNRNADGT